MLLTVQLPIQLLVHINSSNNNNVKLALVEDQQPVVTCFPTTTKTTFKIITTLMILFKTLLLIMMQRITFLRLKNNQQKLIFHIVLPFKSNTNPPWTPCLPQMILNKMNSFEWKVSTLMTTQIPTLQTIGFKITDCIRPLCMRTIPHT